MVALQENPPTAENAHGLFGAGSVIDARKSLAPPLNERDAYPGLAVSMFLLAIPLTAFTQGDLARPLGVDMLADAARRFRDDSVAGAQKSWLTPLVHLGLVVEKSARESAIAKGTPRTNFPNFTNEGISEQYLDSTFGSGDATLRVAKDSTFTSTWHKSPSG